MPVDLNILRARALLGTPFRLHGRDPANGLDCVGLVARACDIRAQVPTGYALRNSSTERWITIMDQFAHRRAGLNMEPGDIVMVQAGVAQLHVGIWTGCGFIHADAGLRRVVETPGPLCWPVIATWRYLRDLD